MPAELIHVGVCLEWKLMIMNLTQIEARFAIRDQVLDRFMEMVVGRAAADCFSDAIKNMDSEIMELFN